MQKFILEANIARFEKLLGEAVDDSARQTMRELIATSKRELSLLDSASQGAEGRSWRISPQRSGALEGGRSTEQFLQEFQASSTACMLLDPGPGLRIVDINPAFETMAQVARAGVVGRPLFEAFPENPANLEADGVSNLYRSLQTAARTDEPHVMDLQRYDTCDEAGVWHERYWLPVNMPISDLDGRLVYLMQQVAEVTDEVRASRAKGG